MSAHFRYLSYVARHKWFVLVAGLQTGAPLWRLLVHDWSKLTRAEWGPYVHYFYGDENLPEDEGGWAALRRAQLREEFDRAWLHHQHHNPHHWQHWLLREDDGPVKTLRMPDKFVREMVADWIGAGRAIIGRWGCAEWYATNAENIALHDETRAEVEALIARVGA